MSEEAKIAYLQEKIHEARRNQIVAYVATFVIGLPSGFLLALMGLSEDISFIVGGVILAIGILVGSYYGYQKNKLMEQLKRMAEFTSYKKSERSS